MEASGSSGYSGINSSILLLFALKRDKEDYLKWIGVVDAGLYELGSKA